MLEKSVSLVLLSLFPLVAQSQTEQWEWNHMWNGGMFFGWMMWFWVAAIVLVIVWAIKISSDRNKSSTDRLEDNSAMSVLKTRLAKGEITKEEYFTLKEALES